MDILKQHLKTSVRKSKLGRKWVFQEINDPKHTSKVDAKWLKDNKVKILELHQLCQENTNSVAIPSARQSNKLSVSIETK